MTIASPDLHLVLSADIHANIYPAYPEMFGNIQRALRDTCAFAKELPNGVVALLGDLFDPRSGKVPVSVLDPIFRLIREAQEDVHIVILPGNHGRGSEDKYDHSERPLGGLPNVTFIDSPTTLDLEGRTTRVQTIWIPYTDDREEFIQWVLEHKASLDPDRHALLFTHQGYVGGWVGEEEPGWTPDEKLWSLPDDLFAGFAHVFSGHFHKHQTREMFGAPVTYVGSPIQHDFGDRGQDRGVVVVECYEEGIDYWQRIYPAFPRFHYVPLTSLVDLRKAQEGDQYDGDYIRCIVTHPEVTPEGIAEIKSLRTLGTIWNLPRTVEARVELCPEATPQEWMKAWLAYAYAGLEDTRTACLEEGHRLFSLVADDIQVQEKTSHGLVSFDKLVLENFGSFPQATLDLTGSGVTVISGDNGAGKTTLGEALPYSVYGEHRGAANSIINRNAKDCKVITHLRAGIVPCRIERGRGLKGKPTLKFFEGSKEQTGDIQEHITRAVGVSYEVFKQTVWLRKVMPFAASTNKGRHQLLDNVLQQEFWDLPEKSTRKVVGESKEDVARFEGILQAKTDSLEAAEAAVCNWQSQVEQHQLNQEQHRKDLERSIETAIRNQDDLKRQLTDHPDFPAQLAKIELELEATRKAINDLPAVDPEQLKELRGLSAEMRDALAHGRFRLRQIEMDLRKAKNTATSAIESSKSLIGRPCPTCHIPVTEDRVAACEKELLDALEKTVEALEEERTTLTGEIAENESLETELKTQVTELEGTLSNGAALQAKHTQLNAKKQSIVQQQSITARHIQSLEGQIKNFDAIIQQRRDELAKPANTDNPFLQTLAEEQAKYEALAEDIQQDLGNLEHAQELLRFQTIWLEGFGRSGIRSLVLDSHLPTLEKLTNENLLDLADGQIQVRIHSTGSTGQGKVTEEICLEVVNLNGHDDYERNSSGEQTMIDIAITIAVDDLLLSLRNHGFNLLWLDEVADPLAAPACERLAKLLKKRAQKRRIILITHNPILVGLFEPGLEVRKVGQWESELVPV